MPTINTFGDDWQRRIIRAVESHEAQGNRTHRRRYPVPGGATPTTGGGEAGTACGCCNHLKCLNLPAEIDPATFIPDLYRFTTAPGFNCFCDDTTGIAGTVTLSRVTTETALIYESDHVECIALEGTGIPCTTNANWEWDSYVQGGCAGDGTTTWICNSGNWVITGACVDPCEDQTLTQDELDLINGTACDGPEDEGLTFTTPCISGAWLFVDVDDPDCTCTPIDPGYDPDWDGIGDPPTAITECTGTRPADGTTDTIDTFWRLTIGTLNEYCVNDTTLELIQGETAILTYKITNCREFCPLCENTLTLTTCGPIDECEFIPQTICIGSRVPAETCPDRCPIPVALLLTNYRGGYLDDVTGWLELYGDCLLMPVDGIPCYWKRDFYHDWEESNSVSLDPEVCADPVLCNRISTGILEMEWDIVTGWSLHENVSTRYIATENVPACGIYIGDDVGQALFSPNGSQLTYAETGGNAGCTDTFTIRWDLDVEDMVIDFVDLSDVNPDD